MSNERSQYNKAVPELDSGLSEAQVKERQALGLTNEIKESSVAAYFKIIWKNCFTFFNVLCLICVIALIIVRAPLANFTFALIFGLNLIIGIAQEMRSKHIVEKLKIVSDSKTTVIRDGKKQEILTKQIVVDDVITLNIGDQIPADAIIASGDIEVNESLLTGESVAVKKSVGDVILGGSFIVSGSCIARIDKVALDCFAQKLSTMAKKHKAPVSKLMKAINTIIKCIGFAIVPIGALAFVVNYFNLSGDFSGFYLWQHAAIRTAAVVIGMIPSGMFLLTSMALAVGIIKLSTHNTLVQDMFSLEMLARIDVLCLDKTGTITDDNMKVKCIVPLSDKSEQDVTSIIASMQTALGDSNQTAKAISQFCADKEISSLQAVKLLHFSSERKLSAVTFDKCGTFALGASNFVMPNLDKQLALQADSYVVDGLRVLLLAHSESKIDNDTLPTDLKPIAFIVLQDNIRPEAIETIDWFKNNNVAVKVISGDAPAAVSNIAMRAGIEGADKYIDLTTVTDEELALIADKYTVFGRVSPQQKRIIVKSLKKSGHVVGMTGDGVNDILAMKEADCSITVSSGADAAKSVAKIVLLDDNFNSMPKVVVEGRRVINNISQSSSIYLMKTLFTAVIALIAIIMRSPYPFEPRHMIALEWAIIGIPTFFLSIQPNKKLVEGNFISEVLFKAIPGAIVLIFNLYAISLIGGLFAPSDLLMTTVKIVAVTMGGWTFLTMLCIPFNKFRTILMTVDTVILLIWVLFLLGTSFFGLYPLIEITTTYKYLFVIAGLMFLDFPIIYFTNKLLRYLTDNLAKKLKSKKA